MKSSKAFPLLFLLVAITLSLPAVAGVVNLQFNGLPTGNSYFGVASYPYNLSVNGGPNQWMMCLGLCRAHRRRRDLAGHGGQRRQPRPQLQSAGLRSRLPVQDGDGGPWLR